MVSGRRAAHRQGKIALPGALAEAHFDTVPGLPPPFAPPRAVFVAPRLAALAARASLGGAREALLGAVMAARLAAGALGPHALPLETRQRRASGARTWLTALTIPAKTRNVLLRAFGASATDDLDALADAVVAVTDVTAAHLDRSARSELTRLAESIRRAGDALAGPADRPVA